MSKLVSEINTLLQITNTEVDRIWKDRQTPFSVSQKQELSIKRKCSNHIVDAICTHYGIENKLLFQELIKLYIKDLLK